MVPSSFVFMDALPLTPNGKVDRKVLQNLDGEAEVQRQVYIAPRTTTETIVARVWGETLSLSVPLGVEDNFFDLGGHSFGATRMIATLRSTFDVDVGLKTLFERPTIAGISEVIDLILSSRRVREPETPAGPREEFEF